MAKFQLKWGILATGGIAETFSRDLWVNPETRGVKDIEHVVVAAASSTSADRVKAFLKEVRAPDVAKAYGSYAELAADPNVDIVVYIATPHSHHYRNAMQCLLAGKPVLCEKAFTTNAAQLERLIKVAKAKDLFLMEALWTRYFPLSIHARARATDGTLGAIHRVTADFSVAEPPESSFADTHRMVNMDLAGGVLLDLCVYSLTHVFQILYATQTHPRPLSVLSALRRYLATGAEEMATVLLTFPREGPLGDAHGVAMAALRVGSDPDGKGSAGAAIRIQGSKGELQIFPPACRPTRTKLVLLDGTVEERVWEMPGPGKGSGWANGFGKKEEWNAEGVGHGMFWEADECACAEGWAEGGAV